MLPATGSDVMKDLSTAASSSTLLIFLGISYLTYFLVTSGRLETDPNIIWTHEQYGHVMSLTIPSIFALCCVSSLWFYFTFRKDFTKKGVMSKIVQACKKGVDVLILVLCGVILFFTVRDHPDGINKTVIVRQVSYGVRDITQGCALQAHAAMYLAWLHALVQLYHLNCFAPNCLYSL